jgi:hypothetical protein
MRYTQRELPDTPHPPHPTPPPHAPCMHEAGWFLLKQQRLAAGAATHLVHLQVASPEQATQYSSMHRLQVPLLVRP